MNKSYGSTHSISVQGNYFGVPLVYEKDGTGLGHTLWYKGAIKRMGQEIKYYRKK